MKKGIIKDKDVLLYKDGAKVGRKSFFMNGFPFSKRTLGDILDMVVNLTGRKISVNNNYKIIYCNYMLQNNHQFIFRHIFYLFS